MAELMTTDVRALLDRQPFDHSAVADLREVLGRDPSRYRTLRDAVAAMRDREKGAMKADVHLRLGVGEVLLGRYTSGLEHLNKAGDNGLAHSGNGQQKECFLDTAPVLLGNKNSTCSLTSDLNGLMIIGGLVHQLVQLRPRLCNWNRRHSPSVRFSVRVSRHAEA